MKTAEPGSAIADFVPEIFPSRESIIAGIQSHVEDTSQTFDIAFADAIRHYSRSLLSGTEPEAVTLKTSLETKRGNCMTITACNTLAVAALDNYGLIPSISWAGEIMADPVSTEQSRVIHAFGILCTPRDNLIRLDVSSKPMGIQHTRKDDYGYSWKLIEQTAPNARSENGVIQVRMAMEDEQILREQATAIIPSTNVHRIDTYFVGLRGIASFFATVNRLAGLPVNSESDIIMPRIAVGRYN